MLKAYRVHRKDCAKGASKWDRKVENCTCPVYMGGECGGRFFKTHNLHTLNWAQAQKFIADANLRGSREAPEAEKPHKDQMPVETAIDKFPADIRDRLRKPTVKKYLVLLKRRKCGGEVPPGPALAHTHGMVRASGTLDSSRP